MTVCSMPLARYARSERKAGASSSIHARDSGILGILWHDNTTKKRLSVYALLQGRLVRIIGYYGPFGIAERDHILLTEVHDGAV